MSERDKPENARAMSKDAFWDIIAQARKSYGQDDEMVYEYIKKQLIELGPDHAQDFHDILHAYSSLADKLGLWSVVNLMGQSSDDSFIDFRSWLISQGRDAYFAALKNPDSLADMDPGDGFWFESLTYVGDAAKREMCGRSAFDETDKLAYKHLLGELAADIEYSDYLDYPFETDELPAYFPRVSGKCPYKEMNWNYANSEIRLAREDGPPPRPQNTMEMGGM